MARIDMELSGGCQCGAVRYRTTQILDNAHVCHCRMCQKAAGNFFMALVGAPLDSFQWTRGTPSSFKSSEHVERGFCAHCGTPLFYDGLASAHINVTLGSLDDPDDVRPIAQSGVESRVVWFPQLARLPEHESNEGEGGEARHVAIRDSNRQHPDYDTDHWPPEDAS